MKVYIFLLQHRTTKERHVTLARALPHQLYNAFDKLWEFAQAKFEAVETPNDLEILYIETWRQSEVIQNVFATQFSRRPIPESEIIDEIEILISRTRNRMQESPKELGTLQRMRTMQIMEQKKGEMMRSRKAEKDLSDDQRGLNRFKGQTY